MTYEISQMNTNNRMECKKTYTFIIRRTLLIALLRLALWHRPELLGRPVEKLPLDLAVLSAEGQVVRRVSAVGKTVDISSQSNEQVHQFQVLQVYGQMERRPATALLLNAINTMVSSLYKSFMKLESILNSFNEE